MLAHQRRGCSPAGPRRRPLAVPRRRLAGIDLAAVDPGDLALLPVMTKAEMMNELDDVFTDRRSPTRASSRRSPRPGPNRRVARRPISRSPREAAPANAACSCSTRPPRRQFFGSLTRAWPRASPRWAAAAGRPADRDGRRRLPGPPDGRGRATDRGRRPAVPVPSVPVTLPLPEIVASSTRCSRRCCTATRFGRLAAVRTGRAPADHAGRGHEHERDLTPELRAAIARGRGAR